MTPRFHIFIRRVFASCVLALIGAMLLAPSQVLAHNEFVESTPADGDIVATVPPEWEITFTKDVPLETASGEVVNSDGVRTTLPTPTHGSATNVIRFALPPELSGTVTARWKLVSEDGHVVQGRVNFTISSSTAATDAIVAPPSSTSTDITTAQTNSSSITSPAPSPVRWAVRSMGFGAVMFVGGLLFVERLLSIATLTGSRGPLFSRIGVSALAVVPFIQNLFLIGDIRNTNVFSAIPHFFSTFDLTLGAMLIMQTFIGLVAGYIIYSSSTSHAINKTNQQFLIALFGMYLIALAFSGHSRTMSWPLLGIPIDVIHTGAAAIWLGGLAVLALLVIPRASTAGAIAAYRQFGPYAQYAVIAIAVTGVIQTLRLHGDIVSLFTESHGRILLLKILVVAAMLKVADINRKRMLRWINPDAQINDHRISLLWRASITEVVTGGIVLAITATLVTASFS